MIRAGHTLSPWGRTSREHYWITLIILGCGVACIWAIGSALGALPSLFLRALVVMIYTVATMRRLHDAGFARWWAALCFFPMSITWNLFEVQVGMSTWQFVDLSTAIKLIPALIGLVSKTQGAPISELARIFR
ncbi:DUF805 domain-containing protein [Sphingopyxis sp.]|uniref:DUF805 domain-containing protein n=1 Tax=Sphingopyxis sp. TaxID=1908224 RepID=UPI003D0ECB51